MIGFERYSDETLLRTQENLLKGLTKVSESITDGTKDVVGPKGEAPPMQSGQLTLMLLKEVSLELAVRGLPSVAVDLDRMIREAHDGNQSR